jgi:hypothetical protein
MSVLKDFTLRCKETEGVANLALQEGIRLGVRVKAMDSINLDFDEWPQATLFAFDFFTGKPIKENVLALTLHYVEREDTEKNRQQKELKGKSGWCVRLGRRTGRQIYAFVDRWYSVLMMWNDDCHETRMMTH